MTLDTILDQLKSERGRLDHAIAVLEGSAPRRRGRPIRMAPTGPPRRKMSAEARRKISEAKRKWWAAQKKKAKGA